MWELLSDAGVARIRAVNTQSLPSFRVISLGNEASSNSTPIFPSLFARDCHAGLLSTSLRLSGCGVGGPVGFGGSASRL